MNRYEKVDPDAAEWQPAQNRCWFAVRVIAVRQRYALTIDRREADALDQVLAGCASTELIMFARGEVPATATPAARVPEDHPNGRPAWPLCVISSAWTADNDGRACER